MTKAGVCAGCPARAGGFFSCLSGTDLKLVESDRTPHVYKPRQALFYEGNPAVLVYCVREGHIKLWRSGHDGGQHVLGTRGAGDLVGFRAVLVGKGYTATAEALARSTACAIPAERFLGLARENGAFAFAMLRWLATMSITSESNLVARSFECVRQRVAAFLVGSVGPRPDDPAQPFALPGPFSSLPREELALLIGTSAETLSRTLHAFANQGILELKDRKIYVLDFTRLRRAAR
jgi:CRP/FNR family transcriptional regulator, polysaccharide utilization system transcription regulator